MSIRPVFYLVEEVIALLRASKMPACDELKAITEAKIDQGWRFSGIAIARKRTITELYTVFMQFWRGKVGDMEICYQETTLGRCTLISTLYRE